MKKIKLLIGLAAAICLASSSQATLLAPGASGAVPAGLATAPVGLPFVGGFGPSPLDGTVFSWFGVDALNPIAGGGLTFYYQVNNLPPGLSPIEGVSALGFSGLTIDVTSIPGPGNNPSSASRSAFGPGDVVTFRFDGASAIFNGSSSDILVVHTSYRGPVGITTGGVIDGFGRDVNVLAPVPEPTTIIAGALLLLPFGASTLRMLRRNRTTV